MRLRCETCGGNVWRQRNESLRANDQVLVSFTCDFCATQADNACMRATSVEEVDKILAAKRSQETTAIADLQRQLEAERAAHRKTKTDMAMVRATQIAERWMK